MSYAYFFSGGGWNQASRFNLVRSILDDGTVRIDRYQGDTGDKAYYQGHFYSDKAPGTSLLAVPIAAVTRLVLHALGAVRGSRNELTALAYVSTLILSGLSTVAAGLALMLFGRRLGLSPGAAGIGALAFGVGTPAWAYATFFWGHAPAGASLFVAFLSATEFSRDRSLSKSFIHGSVIGALGALAVTLEFPAAGAAVIVGILALANAARARGMPAAVATSAGILAGAIPPVLGLLAYQQLAFGSPFRLPYQSVVGFDGMKEGLLGITRPHVDILGQLAFGARKGLVWLAPTVLVAPFGFWVLAKRRRVDVLTAVGIFVYYLLLNASYHYWDGGFSYGPRILGAGLPFLCVGVMGALAGPRWLRRITVVLVAASVALTFAAVAVHSMTPDGIEWPFRTIFLPSLISGKLSQNSGAFFDGEPTPAFNLGQLIGLRGTVSLMPLLMLWSLGALLYWRRSPARNVSAEQSRPSTPRDLR